MSQCWEYQLCVIKTQHVSFSGFLFPSVASAEVRGDLSLEPGLKGGNMFSKMHASAGDFPGSKCLCAKPEHPCVSPGSGRGKSLYTGPHWRPMLEKAGRRGWAMPWLGFCPHWSEGKASCVSQPARFITPGRRRSEVAAHPYLVGRQHRLP